VLHTAHDHTGLHPKEQEALNRVLVQLRKPHVREEHERQNRHRNHTHQLAKMEDFFRVDRLTEGILVRAKCHI